MSYILILQGKAGNILEFDNRARATVMTFHVHLVQLDDGIQLFLRKLGHQNFCLGAVFVHMQNFELFSYVSLCTKSMKYQFIC